MQTYVVRRILLTVPVLFGVTIAVFSMLHLLPVDPAQMMLMDATSGTAPTSVVTDEMMADMRGRLGLDKPIWEQYINFLWKALHGDLGHSFRTNRPVSDLLMEQLPYTIVLTLAGMVAALILGLLFGTVAGLRPNSWVDSTTMAFAVTGVSMPNFWLGLMLIYLFALRLGWLPALGTGSPKALILPALTLGLSASAIIARLTRSSLIDTMRSDYITTARAKGLAEWKILFRHAYRNTLVPVITIVGLQFGALMSGAVVVETVFGRPGIGRLGVQGILQQDFPLVQGFVLFVGTIYVLTNLAVDLAYGALDPRIRYQ